MMKHLVYNIFCCYIILLLVSCEKKIEVVEYGSIYGTVVDKNTGSSLQNASVELQNIGLKTVTGSDGQFEFSKVEEGKYTLHVTRAGYKDYTSTDIIISGNADKKVDVQLEPLPPALTIINDSQNEIDSVNFGDQESDVTRSFIIFNNSENVLEWSISHQSSWIKSFSDTIGKLNPNKSISIRITIDRERLNNGVNSAIVHITSNNGSKQLVVTAERLNIVKTENATDVHAFYAVLHAKILWGMNPVISEYGFVYSSLPEPSLTNGAAKTSSIGTPKVGEYAMRVDSLEREKTYYFRSFVTNNIDTIYGEQKQFTTVVHKPNFSISLSNTTASKVTVTYKVSDAGIPLQEMGICWSIKTLPTIEDNHQEFGENPDQTYTYTIEGLEPDKEYYIQVYAINEDGVHYSTEKYTKTKDGKPSVTTLSTYSSCICGVDYLIVEGSATTEVGTIEQWGICYSIYSNPTVEGSYVEAPLNGTNNFTCRIDGLESGTKYYFQAFAKNEYGTNYGKEGYYASTYYTAKLMGHVYDNQGHLIPSAVVDSPDDASYTAMTDANGYYEINFTLKSNRTKTFTFRANKNGYEKQEFSVTILPGQTTQQDFTLTSNNSQEQTQETGSYVTLPDGSLMVQTVDKAAAQWGSANSSCEASTLGGYTDWRLPTLAELRKIYTYRTQIGGFPSRAVTNNNYWSSTPGSRSGYYYYVNFNDGTSGEMPRVNSFKVRAVRSVQ